MKVVVIGATGLIGSKAAARLRSSGHEVVAASRSSGVNVITGDGLAGAMKGADAVLDVSNSTSFDEKTATEFFETSTRNLLAAEAAAGVKLHVSLGVVGTEQLQDCGYFRAKLVQENLIKAGSIPYTIVHATQFFEFVGGIADAATVGDTVHASTGHMQAIAAGDVSETLAEICTQPAVNGVVEIAGPERLRQSELIEKLFKATGDKRKVQASADALYFGTKVDNDSLCPGAGAKLSATSFEQWLKKALCP